MQTCFQKVTYFLGCLFVLGGCANDYSGNNYTPSTVGEVQRTDAGTIISLRKVSIKSDDVGMGAGIGAATGGLAGALFGSGGGKVATTLLGAAAGGFAGHAIESSKKTEGVEYTVKLETGSLITITQGLSPSLSVGQKVHVINSNRGRGRLVSAS